jgi:hypothetical protein
MLTANDCLAHAIKMDSSAAEGPENCREVFALLAEGWRAAGRMAQWQDEWEKHHTIEVNWIGQ